MTNTFKTFADAVQKRFTAMSTREMFLTGTDDLWEVYLNVFPPGTNPPFRVRTEHDCSTCRHFVRNLGSVVTIEDGNVRSVWSELGDLPAPYGDVANAMDAYVTSRPLAGLFRTSGRYFGAETTRGLYEGHVESWHHFHAPVETRHQSSDVGADRGQFTASVDVFRRGLDELTADAIETVVDLITEKALYRGEEHLRAVQEFRTLQHRYWLAADRTTFVFANATHRAARFRNTVVGTLVQDLSEGVDLESAVRSFEAKVAPTNYKRPKALVTPAMVTAALKTVETLGIEPSLQRRFARLDDVSVNDVLWVDRNVRPLMKDDGLAGVLMAAATPKPVRTTTATPVGIETFMKDVLPGAGTVELLVKNEDVGRFVSLTTGANDTARPIFKWDNDFGWSYNGNVTDSIKERVKRAGGNVTGRLRVSLSWFNRDDLDIHIYEPNGNHIFYGNRDGKLDVDMNVRGESREPVENVTWAGAILDGTYEVKVNNYTRRETADVGFVIETESDGRIENFRYDQPVGQSATVTVGTMTVKGGSIVKFAPGKDIQAGSASKDVWGVKTETFVKVASVMHSPNFWGDNAVGLKHFIFALEGCLNDQPTRGIFNEFLRGDLDQHRKVFEVLGDRTKCPPAADQVSGLGFSSNAIVTARIDGGRLYSIQF